MARIDTTKTAAQTVAEKVAKGKKESANTNTASTTSAIDSRIPGLLSVTPDLIPGMMPIFHPEKYHVADPLNPPETIPQATQAQFDKGMKIYDNTARLRENRWWNKEYFVRV